MSVRITRTSHPPAQVNQNLIDEGMALLVEALDCKWVAVESAKVLQQV